MTVKYEYVKETRMQHLTEGTRNSFRTTAEAFLPLGSNRICNLSNELSGSSLRHTGLPFSNVDDDNPSIAFIKTRDNIQTSPTSARLGMLASWCRDVKFKVSDTCKSNV